MLISVATRQAAAPWIREKPAGLLRSRRHCRVDRAALRDHIVLFNVSRQMGGISVR
jgi:hypothetical protein